jgi:multidrug efflux system membrane fusion protein
VFTLPEDNVQSVIKQFHSTEGLSIEAYDRRGKTKLAQGLVYALDNQIDPTTGTVKLKGQFDNEDGALFSNQFINIKMKMDTLHSVIIIPTAAVQKGTIGSYAYVLNEDQTVSVRLLTLGPSEGEQIAVLTGLKSNEQVVVDGADKLRDKTKVKLISRNPEVDNTSPLADKKSHQGMDRKHGNQE